MRPTAILTAVRTHPRWLAAIAVAALVAVNLGAGALAPASNAPAGPPADLATVDAWLEGQLRDAGIPGAALVVVHDGRTPVAPIRGREQGRGRPTAGSFG